MTYDSLMARPDKYSTKIQEEVFERGLNVYASLANMYKKPNELVYEEELEGFIYADIHSDMKDQLIEEAIERKDYLLFGMTKDDFTTKCHNGSLDDVAVHPHINRFAFEQAFVDFVSTHQLMLKTRCGYVENSVLQEVW